MEPRALPDPHDVVIVRSFLAPDEHETLLHWAAREFAEGRLNPNKAGTGRFFARYHDGHPGLPDAVRGVKARAIRSFGISSFEEEPRFRCFLGCNTEGGFVHAHVDDKPPGKHHIRLNIMLSRPESGGMPIVGARQLAVAETDLWCFHPGVMRHGSTPVVGSRPRFVLSIGLLVPAVFEEPLVPADVDAYQAWERTARGASADRRQFMPVRSAFRLRPDDVPRRAAVRLVEDRAGTIVVNAETGRRAAVGHDQSSVEQLLEAVDGTRPARDLPLEGGDALVGTAILLPDAVADLEGQLPLAEIVRFPQQSPYAVPREYWENQIAVRARLPRLHATVEKGDDFLLALRGLHRLATVGESGRSYYGAAGEVVTTPGELRSGDVMTMIDAPMLDALKAWASQLGLRDQLCLTGTLDADGHNAVIRRDEGRVCIHVHAGSGAMHRLLERTRLALARALDATAARDAGAAIASCARLHHAFVAAHPFGNVNNSLAMNVVNDLLARAGARPLPHLLLDHLALRLDADAYQQAFARIALERDVESRRGAPPRDAMPLLHLLMRAHARPGPRAT